MKNCSSAEFGTSSASMNRTGKTTAAKEVHNNYNEYNEFHEREVDTHICASFMQMLEMTRLDGMLAVQNSETKRVRWKIMHHILNYLSPNPRLTPNILFPSC